MVDKNIIVARGGMTNGKKHVQQENEGREKRRRRKRDRKENVCGNKACKNIDMTIGKREDFRILSTEKAYLLLIAQERRRSRQVEPHGHVTEKERTQPSIKEPKDE